MLSALPQHTKHSDSDNVWMTHTKIDQDKFTFPQISHLSSNRRIRNLAFYFQFTTLARKLTHRMKFEHVWMQKDMNFGNAMILHHFRPEKCQKSYPERHEFWKHHNSLLLQARETPKILPRKTQISETP